MLKWATATCGKIPAQDGKVGAGRKKTTLFINKKDILPGIHMFWCMVKKRKKEAGWKERSKSPEATAHWEGDGDNKGPAVTLRVLRATGMCSGIILVLLFTPMQAQMQKMKMVEEQKTKGSQEFLCKLLGQSKLLPHCQSEPQCPGGDLGKRNCSVGCYIILGVNYRKK